MSTEQHTCDADCAPHLGHDKRCAVCGVSHATPCTECGGCGFHKSTCSESGVRRARRLSSRSSVGRRWCILPRLAREDASGAAVSARRRLSSRECTIVELAYAIKHGIGAIPLSGQALRDALAMEGDCTIRVGNDWTLTDHGATAFCGIDRDRTCRCDTSATRHPCRACSGES